jgi:hypothetical protein
VKEEYLVLGLGNVSFKPDLYKTLLRYFLAGGNDMEGLGSTIEKLVLPSKVYYTRVKQLINAGSFEQSDYFVYKYTNLRLFF